MGKTVIDLIKAPELENCFLDSLKQKIIGRLKEAGLADAKFKLEVKNVLFCAVMIESAIASQQKLNKRQFLLDIFQELYGLSEDDKTAIRTTVDHLHIAGKIKRKNYYKLYCTSLLEIFRM